MSTTRHLNTAAPVASDQDPGPRTRMAFEELRCVIFGEGALDHKTKQLIAVAVAHTTRCPRCIDGHTALAARAGATPQEITESIWVATEVHVGGTFAHPTRAVHGRDRDRGAS